MGLKTWIWASKLGFGPRDWNLGLEAGIWAPRLRKRPGGWGEGGAEMKEEEEEEKIPHMCESIGHQSLRGRCPKAGQRVLLTIYCPWATVSKLLTTWFFK